jgi:hypothetical protein
VVGHVQRLGCIRAIIVARSGSHHVRHR